MESPKNDVEFVLQGINDGIGSDVDTNIDYAYEDVAIESDTEDDVQSEDLDDTIRSLQRLSLLLGKGVRPDGTTFDPFIKRKVEVADDFIRNFLYKRGLRKTLDIFEKEWEEMLSKGEINESEVGKVPDEYTRHLEMQDAIENLQNQLHDANHLAQCRQKMFEKIHKERNVHRMHHNRIAQEKNRLITIMKNLKRHYSKYEPVITTLKKKYEDILREKAMLALERDRLLHKVTSLLSLRDIKDAACETVPTPPKSIASSESTKPDPLLATRTNHFIDMDLEPTPVNYFNLQKTFKGHLMSVSNVVIHPKKPVVVTASDDCTWRMWGLPAGDLIMTGDGHKDWVAGLDFHPSGMQLVSSSGDCTVKVWSFEKARCIHTFTEHTQAVWAIAFHFSGDVVASSSLDHTSRIWDLLGMRCRGTLRGHVDSVNGVVWQNCTNILCTASSDKTVSLWDARSSLCVQTFYGHQSSCNHAAFDPKGFMIASVDANGVVKLWDVRKVQEFATINVGPHSANKCCFDRSGHVVAIASNDSRIKCFHIGTEVVPINELRGHNDAVQALVFDPNGKFLVSGGSDSTFRIWSA